MIYNMTIFDKIFFTDQDRGHNLATIFNWKWRQTGPLSERNTYPKMVLISCPNNIWSKILATSMCTRDLSKHLEYR